MGIVVGKIWGPQFTDDSITGLKAEEKVVLKDTFNALKQDMSKTGERLFVLYFVEYPENKKYFRDFKNKNSEELPGDPKLIAHGLNVMCSLNGIILSLNEPEALVTLIQKVGYSHGKRNIGSQAFKDLKVVFVKLLQETLKSKYTTQVGEIWSKTFDIIVKVFEMGVQQYKDDKDKD